MQPIELEDICLVEYASSYTCSNPMVKTMKHPCIICYIRYNQQKDPKNLFREKMMLCPPYRETKIVLK